MDRIPHKSLVCLALLASLLVALWCETGEDIRTSQLEASTRKLLARPAVKLEALDATTRALVEGAGEKLKTPPLRHAVVEAPKLTLLGTQTGSSDALAYVELDTVVASYHIGDAIKTWVVDAIGERSIVLSYQHIQRTYYLEESADFVGKSTAARQDEEREQERRRMAAISRMQDSAFAAKVRKYMHGRNPWEVRYPMGVEATGIIQVSGELYEMDRERVLTGVLQESYLRHARFNSESEAVQLEDIVPGSLFEQVGLEDGDIITAINQQAIESRADLLGAYYLFKGETDLVVEYQRNGEFRNIHLLLVGSPNENQLKRLQSGK